jgi:WD40 repeat protein/serine/threonine protein kinase
MENLQGVLLKGYKLEEQIGSGGFGAVYRADQATVGREVAVKIILPSYSNNADFIRRFESEAYLVARLEHPHITPLHDFWRDPTGAYLVMRYLRGGSIQQSLQNGPYELNAISQLLDQIASALDFAHRNDVIHRDIKPGNILLDEDGNAYLADFGIAKDLAGTTDNKTSPDAVVGSLDYISPEQARNEPVTPRTDIYSLGVTLYEMITGEHPFKDASSIERLYKHLTDPLPAILNLEDDVHDAINKIIQKATTKNPENRYTDVLALATAFREGIGRGNTRQEANVVEKLTLREQEILLLITRSMSNREIADELVVTVSTIKWHINQLYKKLGVRSRVQAIVRARELNLIVANETYDDLQTEIGLPASISLPEPENPYKGLHAFRMTDARDFFGRDDLVEKLITSMSNNNLYHRFLAIVGPSGSGKSSLVKAGLIPALWKGSIPGSEKWFVVDMVPGTHPLDKLETALIRISANQTHNLREQLQRDERGLLRVADIILPDDDTELVIVVDQFEEVFTLVEDEEIRLQFLELLRVATTSERSRIRVVITLRADYYDRPLHYPEFGELVRNQMETVLPLSAKGLERTVRGPAERVGVTFEQGLVEQIISSMNYQAGALPLLQYALTELFERRSGRVLTNEAYQQIGGAVGALANRAEEIFENLTEEAQELTHQMFMRLVTLGEGAEDTRRRVTHTEILSLTKNTDLMEEVIDQFSGYRLLSLDHDVKTRQPTLEVAHEAILREWDRLRQWLHESRDDIRQERIVAQLAHEWDSHERDISYLLRGSRLDQVRKWRESTTLVHTPLEHEFIKSSLKQLQAEKEDKQAQEDREMALEQRAIRRLRALVGVLLLGVILAGSLTAFSLIQIGIAEKERDNAQANFTRAERIRLAAQAQISLERGEDVRVPALLAIRSLNLGYSPEADGALLAAVARGFSQQVYLGHTDTVMSTKFSVDGQRHLTTSVDGTARLWDTTTGAELQRFIGHTGMVNSALFFNDEKYVLTNGTDRTVRQWDVETGQEVRRFADHGSSVWALDISPDEQFISTSDESNIAFLWNTETTELVQEFVGHADVVNTMAFSPDGLTIATGSYDRTIRLWDIETGEEIRQFEGHVGCACTIAFSPDGRMIVSGSPDSTLRLWDVETGGEIHRLLGHTALILSVAFGPDNLTVASGSADNTLRLWSVETGDELQQFLGHTASVTSISYSPDRGFLLSAGGDNTARLWNVDSQEEPKKLEHPLATSSPHSYTMLMSILASDGKTIISGNAAGEIQFWDIDSGKVVHEIVTDNGGLITDIALSHDEKYALTPGGEDSIARLWDVETGEELQRFEGHHDHIEAVNFSSDSKWIGTGSADSTARMWDRDTGKLLQEFIGHEGRIQAVAFSRDNKFIVTSGVDMTARIWDTTTGAELQKLTGHSGAIRTVLFSHDSLSVLTGSDDTTARLWDVETGKEIHRYSGHRLPVRALAFSNEGDLIITASDDQVARVWDVETGNIVRQYNEHESMLRSASISSDNQFVIVGDIVGIYVWRLNLEDVMGLACSNLSSDFDANERIVYGIDNEEDICQNH